jgi:hypothetical protein
LCNIPTFPYLDAITSIINPIQQGTSMQRLPRLLFLLVSYAVLASSQLIIQNPGFEQKSPDGTPEGWSTVSGVVDGSTKHSGSSALRFQHDQWASSTAVSSVIPLKVGHIYRLTAWMKSEAVVSDPNAQYPTPVAGCLTMESFPPTNSSPSVGGTGEWQRVEMKFIATKSKDRIRVHLGYQGNARGKLWVDDVALEEVTDITEYIPLETVRWHGPAFRYEEKGWIFIHIEGKPYQRGFQYGSLAADEIKVFIEKLGVNGSVQDPAGAWNQKRFSADAILLRKYDEEYLTEMKGIADGAAAAGVKIFDRPVDLLDIVTVNSAIDLDYIQSALAVTPNPLTGKTFLSSDDELQVQERLHKCSSFLANNTATADGKIVFGQLFMWGGYTGVHWNVIVDVVPAEGNRLVYQTFPGGIHSGADFYINSAGIMLGETTVQQTPYDPEGTPQSNRIRKAAQYANSVDDVVKIMTTKNNGMYTNDWLIGDVKKNEIAILLLGTAKWKLWRSGKKDWYSGAEGFYWSVNNAKDLDVRKEYVVNADDLPYDYLFRPVNRDIAFWNFYKEKKGAIDQAAAFQILGSSPVNRPHACDGKVTTSEMAEQLVFFAHYGKVTLREQMIGENGRMPDLPNALSRFTLGYAAMSPIYISSKLKEAKARLEAPRATVEPKINAVAVPELTAFDKKDLWHGTVYASRGQDNWIVSSSAAYANMLKQMPARSEDAFAYMRDELTELNHRLLYVRAKEGTVIPVTSTITMHEYKGYQIPRIRGTYLLHQLRLFLGNAGFSEVMKGIHTEFRGKNITTAEWVQRAEQVSGKPLKEFVGQWLEREDLPDVTVAVETNQAANGWNVVLHVDQAKTPYRFLTTVALDAGKERILKLVEVNEARTTVSIDCPEKPSAVHFNAGNDIPIVRSAFLTYQNFFDDFSSTLIVYGTSQQIEANHTIALRYQKMVADRFTEVFQPIRKESELVEKDLVSNDLIVLGGPADNALSAKLCQSFGIDAGRGYFRWQGNTYALNDDGLAVVYPSPYNPAKAVYLFLANSAQQLYQMTKKHQPFPAWGLFKGERLVKKGYHPADGMLLR